jgi:hypothetical protein
MFIKLRENSEGVLAINLNASDKILIRENAGEFVLSFGKDSFAINIEGYPTHERAIQAFHNMMDMLQDGCHLCDSRDL